MSNDKLAEALRELVHACEEHDAMVSRIIGHPAGWNAQYLDSARVALQAHAVEAAQAQPQAAEPVAIIESAEDRHGPYLTHANVVLRVWNGYVPKAGDEIYTHPAPADAKKRETMTPRELAKRIERGEKWKLADEPTPCQSRDAERLAEALRPFAAMLKPHHERLKDDRPIFAIEGSQFTAGDLRRANEALTAHSAQAQPPAASVTDAMTLEELRESLDVGCLPNTDRPRWFAAIDAAIKQREQDANDAARLDWLETHPRLASIVIDGSATDCYLYGISGAPGLKLREILDAAMAKESCNG